MSASKKLNVAVVGAGASGLVTYRIFMSEPEVFNVEIFEQSDYLGGIWVFDNKLDDNITLSPLYKSLRTNLPVEIMAFQDFPFPASGTSFVSHTEVLKYLQDYADHFDITQHIRFSTKVTLVKPVNIGEKIKWVLETEQVKKGRHDTQLFDAVAICNGHFSVPRTAEIPGIELFQGKVMHSQDYRELQNEFNGLKVLCFGGGPSAVDIAPEICSVADKVLLSHRMPRGPLAGKLPSNLHQVRPIVSYNPTVGFEFEDGETSHADILIYCTGYNYEFPFLHRDCGVTVTDGVHVKPLYKQVINTKFPTMGFVGIPQKVLPFPCWYLQAQLFMKYLIGCITLPSEENMNFATSAETLQNSRYPHAMSGKFRAYVNELAEISGVDHFSKEILDIFEKMALGFRIRACEYRDLYDRKLFP